jgi:hypothetical protein
MALPIFDFMDTWHRIQATIIDSADVYFRGKVRGLRNTLISRCRDTMCHDLHVDCRASIMIGDEVEENYHQCGSSR